MARSAVASSESRTGRIAARQGSPSSASTPEGASSSPIPGADAGRNISTTSAPPGAAWTRVVPPDGRDSQVPWAVATAKKGIGRSRAISSRADGASQHALVAQRGEACLVQPQPLAQHLLGVLPRSGGGRR